MKSRIQSGKSRENSGKYQVLCKVTQHCSLFPFTRDISKPIRD